MCQNSKMKIIVSLLLVAAAMLALTCCVRQGDGYETSGYDENGGRETLFSAPAVESTSQPETQPAISNTESAPESTEPPMTEPPATEAVTTPPQTTVPSGPEETVFGGFTGLY